MVTVEEDNKSEEVLEAVKRIVSSAFIKFESDEELVLTLPTGQTEKHKLADVCQTLCIMREQLGIQSFGVTDSGLEEIFVKITEEAKSDDVPDSGNFRLYSLISYFPFPKYAVLCKFEEYIKKTS